MRRAAGAAGNFLAPISNLSENGFRTVIEIDAVRAPCPALRIVGGADDELTASVRTARHVQHYQGDASPPACLARLVHPRQCDPALPRYVTPQATDDGVLRAETQTAIASLSLSLCLSFPPSPVFSRPPATPYQVHVSAAKAAVDASEWEAPGTDRSLLNASFQRLRYSPSRKART